jgi:hypothetical protein
MKIETEAGTAFLDKTDPIKTPELEVITEGLDLGQIREEKMEQLGKTIETKLSQKEETKLETFLNWIVANWTNFINWIKKSIAMMVIFILLGGACGLYIAKIIYDFRMNEITMIGGFVHNKQVYDVKLRP